ncbi:hypothetical protein ACFPZP_16180 [Citrobacter bitternis]|uniref:Uncharacterized protein n=1 Tax=Citrobacter bitternis TaxID=1585982 RepID=A0ABW1Q320_9ENTR
MTGFVASGIQIGTVPSSPASYARSYKTTNNIIETRKNKSTVVSKVLLGVFALSNFLNVGSMTGASPVEIKPIVRSYNHLAEIEAKKEPNAIEKSNSLQRGFNFNVSQWASLLKVERKTIYNWNGKKETRIKNATISRINAFDAFYKEIDINHAPYLKKFIFGRMSDEGIRTVFYEEPLDFNKMVDAYYDIYAQIEGYSVRAKLA